MKSCSLCPILLKEYHVATTEDSKMKIEVSSKKMLFVLFFTTIAQCMYIMLKFVVESRTLSKVVYRHLYSEIGWSFGHHSKDSRCSLQAIQKNSETLNLIKPLRLSVSQT